MAKRIFKQDEFGETGFGNRVVEPNQRLMNKNGSSNVQRRGLSFLKSTSVYQSLIMMSWRRFLFILFFSYLVVNLIFALIYYFIDVDHLNGMVYKSEWEKFLEVFFFSAQSLTTVGYGRINPQGYIDSSIASIEAMLGLLGFALATGLLYGRFSRPIAKILFSDVALLAPYKGYTAIMMRIANKSKSELLDPHATIILSTVEIINGEPVRKFYPLKLELTTVTLLTMSWTLVHPIDEESPLYQWTEQDYKNKNVEFLILIKAYEELFAQTVHSRSSYNFREMVFGAKFNSMIKPGPDGSVVVELNRINDYTPTPLFESVSV